MARSSLKNGSCTTQFHQEDENARPSHTTTQQQLLMDQLESEKVSSVIPTSSSYCDIVVDINTSQKGDGQPEDDDAEEEEDAVVLCHGGHESFTSLTSWRSATSTGDEAEEEGDEDEDDDIVYVTMGKNRRRRRRRGSAGAEVATFATRPNTSYSHHSSYHAHGEVSIHEVSPHNHFKNNRGKPWTRQRPHLLPEDGDNNNNNNDIRGSSKLLVPARSQLQRRSSLSSFFKLPNPSSRNGGGGGKNGFSSTASAASFTVADSSLPQQQPLEPPSHQLQQQQRCASLFRGTRNLTDFLCRNNPENNHTASSDARADSPLSPQLTRTGSSASMSASASSRKKKTKNKTKLQQREVPSASPLASTGTKKPYESLEHGALEASGALARPSLQDKDNNKEEDAARPRMRRCASQNTISSSEARSAPRHGGGPLTQSVFLPSVMMSKRTKTKKKSPRRASATAAFMFTPGAHAAAAPPPPPSRGLARSKSDRPLRQHFKNNMNNSSSDVMENGHYESSSAVTLASPNDKHAVAYVASCTTNMSPSPHSSLAPCSSLSAAGADASSSWTSTSAAMMNQRRKMDRRATFSSLSRSSNALVSTRYLGGAGGNTTTPTTAPTTHELLEEYDRIVQDFYAPNPGTQVSSDREVTPEQECSHDSQADTEAVSTTTSETSTGVDLALEINTRGLSSSVPLSNFHYHGERQKLSRRVSTSMIVDEDLLSRYFEIIQDYDSEQDGDTNGYTLSTAMSSTEKSKALQPVAVDATTTMP